ncbi:hypothetical protein JOC86_003411 [Bacillus pakistanensis]|uniref:Coupling factor for flagellin transcription and translation n=1 Tax=Rossellomorea pakistanensis TaxID=992288 RepID=A0ABS2NG88_9BACI|nr:hypothetical protein [Bacillus pakistanensis]MBM7586859.1 hypothetical protein [Bacillus pakistanensis]
MTTVFFMIISFILNAVALLAIVILYTRQNRLMNVEKQQKKMVKEMEEVISTYLIEMKDENEQFIRRFDKLHRSEANHNTSPLSFPEMTSTIEKSDESKSEFSKESPLTYKKAAAIKAYTNKKEDTPFDDHQPSHELIQKEEEKSEYAQIVLLKKQGYDLNQIAQKLHKGMTEVELIIKFNQNQ